jgi:hypothetical protein
MRAIPGYRKAAAVAALVALLAAPAAFRSAGAHAGSAGGDQGKPAKLFAGQATLDLTLAAPWREFMDDKKAKKRYPGTLEYVDESGARRSMPVAFEPRGLNRLKNCKLPPIKLIFDKAASKGTPFHGNKSLKLVTHCGSGERWEQYAIKEMLAYRIYNLVTERSFRVRALSVTYVDSAEHSSDGPRFAFLIEDDSALARRNHLEKLDTPRIQVAQLEPLENDRFALFEYLIGNTDWAVLNGPSSDRCCHNSKLIGTNLQSNVYAVPYDFDSSGLVDAPYAAPSPTLPIRNNRERLYRGFCANNATLETARREILGLEPRILELVRTESRLAPRSREVAGDYLAKGFEILSDDEKFASNVIARCRK